MKRYFLLGIAVAVISCMQAYFVPGEIKPVDKKGLGEMLFFDPILSKDSTISCASCHKPIYAFADTSRVSLGVGGLKGTRNTPSAMNLSLQSIFFWDGRAQNLEEQALAPIENPIEMNLPIEEALSRLKRSKIYSRYFQEIYSTEPTKTDLSNAIALFERSLETSDSPFDNWKFSDDSTAMTEAAKKGFLIFNGKGKCIQCHFGADFTKNEFRNIGLFNGKTLTDSGRSVISGKKDETGKFKIPSLRNVAVTAPYMHNGMFRSLQEVIDFYNDPVKLVPDAIDRDSLLAKPLGLTMEEKKELEAFLISLTDKRFSHKRKTAF